MFCLHVPVRAEVTHLFSEIHAYGGTRHLSAPARAAMGGRYLRSGPGSCHGPTHSAPRVLEDVRPCEPTGDSPSTSSLPYLEYPRRACRLNLPDRALANITLVQDCVGILVLGMSSYLLAGPGLVQFIFHYIPSVETRHISNRDIDCTATPEEIRYKFSDNESRRAQR